jgi:hypothetical protein
MYSVLPKAGQYRKGWEFFSIAAFILGNPREAIILDASPFAARISGVLMQTVLFF